jgi:hypothetical protein
MGSGYVDNSLSRSGAAVRGTALFQLRTLIRSVIRAGALKARRQFVKESDHA